MHKRKLMNGQQSRTLLYMSFIVLIFISIYWINGTRLNDYWRSSWQNENFVMRYSVVSMHFKLSPKTMEKCRLVITIASNCSRWLGTFIHKSIEQNILVYRHNCEFDEQHSPLSNWMKQISQFPIQTNEFVCECISV